MVSGAAVGNSICWSEGGYIEGDVRSGLLQPHVRLCMGCERDRREGGGKVIGSPRWGSSRLVGLNVIAAGTHRCIPAAENHSGHGDASAPQGKQTGHAAADEQVFPYRQRPRSIGPHRSSGHIRS